MRPAALAVVFCVAGCSAIPPTYMVPNLTISECTECLAAAGGVLYSAAGKYAAPSDGRPGLTAYTELAIVSTGDDTPVDEHGRAIEDQITDVVEPFFITLSETGRPATDLRLDSFIEEVCWNTGAISDPVLDKAGDVQASNFCPPIVNLRTFIKPVRAAGPTDDATLTSFWDWLVNCSQQRTKPARPDRSPWRNKKARECSVANVYDAFVPGAYKPDTGGTRFYLFPAFGRNAAGIQLIRPFN